MKAGTLVLVVCAAIALAAWGDDDSNTSPDPTEATATSGSAANKDLEQRPVIETTGEESPGALVVNDIVVGKGPEAKKGDEVSVQYVGALHADGTEFDASWDRGEPFAFKLGAGQVISGWDEGIVGMRVGGRRELIIPPDFGYGAAGSPPTIPPDATLVFIVDLLDVKPG